jgi:carbonic anhydrase
MTILRLKSVGLLLTLIAVFLLGSIAHGEQAQMTSDSALKLLNEGNIRFSQGKLANPNQDAERRTATADKGQKPFAIILSCADSRVPLELVFDRGIGDIFGVRVAGNVAGTDQMGTIEFGVDQIRIPLLVVLGHTKCGAVDAVVQGAKAEGNLLKLVERIVPPVTQTKKQFPDLPKDKMLDKCAVANVDYVIHSLTAQSPVIKAAVDKGQLKIVGGYYDINTGVVDWLNDAQAKPGAALKN